MAATNLLHADIAEKVLHGFYHVYNTLGHGFLEKVYRNALMLALRGAGLHVAKEVPIKVFFEG